MFLIYALIFWVGAELTVTSGLTFNEFYRSFLAIVFASFGASLGQQFTGDLG